MGLGIVGRLTALEERDAICVEPAIVMKGVLSVRAGHLVTARGFHLADDPTDTILAPVGLSVVRVLG